MLSSKLTLGGGMVDKLRLPPPSIGRKTFHYPSTGGQAYKKGVNRIAANPLI
jgi:hypothetical protein